MTAKYTDGDLNDITLLALHRLAFSAADSEASADMRDRARAAMRRINAALGNDPDPDLGPDSLDLAVHFHGAEPDRACGCDTPGTYARPSGDPPEDGEQCLQCLRYFYDPCYGQCVHCGWQMHPDEEG